MYKELGFDYVECPVVSLDLDSVQEPREKLQAYRNSPLPAKAFNVFFPGGIKVVGPETEPDRIRRYIHRTASALESIGAKIAVLGSGRSRHVPDGWERSRAEEQFVQLLEWIGGQFAGTGITLAIEPLNRKESNIVNSVAEAVMFAQRVNHPSVRVLADFYHMDEEDEPLQTLIDHKDWLAHIHLADTGRLSPGTGSYPYEQFAAALKAAGYSGMISAECTVHDPASELPASLAFMKRIFGEESK